MESRTGTWTQGQVVEEAWRFHARPGFHIFPAKWCGQFRSVFQNPSQWRHCKHPQVLMGYLYWEVESQCIFLFNLISRIFVEAQKFPFSKIHPPKGQIYYTVAWKYASNDEDLGSHEYHQREEKLGDLFPNLPVGNSYFVSHIILGRKSITFGLRVIMGLKSCPVMQI